MQTQTPQIEDHPLAAHFPLASKAELAELAESIKLHGQKVAILLFEGKILDGRNRYRACLIAGVEPWIEDYTGNQPATVVWALNGPRRNLSTSQKAAIAATLLPLIQREMEKTVANLPPEKPAPEPTKTRDLAAEKFGVSGRTVQTAKHVMERSPKLFEQVREGEITVNAAAEKIAHRDKVKKEKAKKVRAAAKAHDDEAEYNEALTRIGKICGQSLLAAIQNGIRLPDRKEVIRYAALTDEQMIEIKPMIDLNWKVARAVKYKMQSLSEGHKIRDLIDRVLIQGGDFTLRIRGGDLHCRFETTPVV